MNELEGRLSLAGAGQVVAAMVSENITGDTRDDYLLEILSQFAQAAAEMVARQRGSDESLLELSFMDVQKWALEASSRLGAILDDIPPSPQP